MNAATEQASPAADPCYRAVVDIARELGIAPLAVCRAAIEHGISVVFRTPNSEAVCVYWGMSDREISEGKLLQRDMSGVQWVEPWTPGAEAPRATRGFSMDPILKAAAGERPLVAYVREAHGDAIGQTAVPGSDESWRVPTTEGDQLPTIPKLRPVVLSRECLHIEVQGLQYLARTVPGWSLLSETFPGGLGLPDWAAPEALAAMLDPNDEFYATELALAVRAWIRFHYKWPARRQVRAKTGTVQAWAGRFVAQPRTRRNIATIANPDIYKKAKRRK